MTKFITATLLSSAVATQVPKNSIRFGRSDLADPEAHGVGFEDCTEYMCCTEKTTEENQWACYGRWEKGEDKTPGWTSFWSNFHRDLVWPVSESAENGCGGHWKVCVARHSDCGNRKECPEESRCRMVKRDHLTGVASDGVKEQGTCTAPKNGRCFAKSRASVAGVRFTGKGAGWDQCDDGLECKRIGSGYSGICCPKDGNGYFVTKTTTTNDKGETVEEFSCEEHDRSRGQRFMDNVKEGTSTVVNGAKSAGSAVAQGFNTHIKPHFTRGDSSTAAPEAADDEGPMDDESRAPVEASSNGVTVDED